MRGWTRLLWAVTMAAFFASYGYGQVAVSDIKRGLVTGGIMWTGAASAQVTIAGTTYDILQSNGTSSPTWTSTPVLTSLSLTAASNQLVFDADGTYTGTLTWTPATSSKTITLPNFTGTVLLDTSSDQVVSNDLAIARLSGQSTVVIKTYSTTAGNGAQLVFARSNSDTAALTATDANDVTGDIVWKTVGVGGTLVTTARIQGIQTGASDTLPITALVLSTADGTNFAERMRVNSSGVAIASLTSGRVTYAGTSGLLSDSANLTFDGSTLLVQSTASEGIVDIHSDTAGQIAPLRVRSDTSNAAWDILTGTTDSLEIYKSAGTPGTKVTITNGGVLNVLTGLQVNSLGATGTFLRGNGTNYVASSTTIPDTFTLNGIFYASSTSAMANGAGLTWDGTKQTITGTLTISNTSATDAMLRIQSTGATGFYDFEAADTQLVIQSNNNAAITIANSSPYGVTLNTLTTPIVYGGSGTSSNNTLSLTSTSGNGSNDAVHIKGGNAGATTIASFFGAGTYAGRSGFGTVTPAAQIESVSTALAQMRLTNGATYADFTVSNVGDLTIAPSGGDTSVTGTLTATTTITAGTGLTLTTGKLTLSSATANQISVTSSSAEASLRVTDSSARAWQFGMGIVTADTFELYSNTLSAVAFKVSPAGAATVANGLTVTTGGATIGDGTADSEVRIDGDGASGKGSLLSFYKDSSPTNYIGHESRILGGTSNRLTFYSTTGHYFAGGGLGIASGGATITGGLIHATTSTPANASATGVTGTIAWDASYIYVCVATDTWKRVAIATW